tara:strand:+ start:1538 stop:2206 length:669 start_codon:yes stop_codon:yes gene_type:complete
VRDSIKTNISSIRKYTKDHQELLRAHHFTYDLISKGDDSKHYIVMGINPGEQGSEDTCKGPTEETSEYDFFEVHGENKNRSATEWSNNARYYLGDKGNIVMTNFFFWSSKGLKGFRERFGYGFNSKKSNKHLDFCKRMNFSLIQIYKPRLIVSPGIGLTKLSSRYDFGDPLETIYDHSKRARLVQRYEYQGIPVVFTKHWTSRWGVTSEEKVEVKEYLKDYL